MQIWELMWTLPSRPQTPAWTGVICYINVSRDKSGRLTYVLRDNDSLTGTFYMNDLLEPRDRIVMNDGDVFTLGATSLILRSDIE